MQPVRWVRLLRWVVFAAVLLGGAYLLWGERDDLLAAARQLSLGRAAISAGMAIAGVMCIERTWLSLIRGFGVRMRNREAAPVFYATQLGKYIPGSVWPVVAQTQLGVRLGVPRRLMLGASLTLLTMMTTTGLLVGGLLLPWSSADGIHQYWWLLLLLPVLIVLLHPRVLISLIDRVGQVVEWKRIDTRISTKWVLRAGMWAGLTWVLLGAHLLVLLSGLANVVDARLIAAAIGGIGLAWAAGLAFVPAPAGAGVREVVLVLTLSPLVGGQASLAAALASRVFLTFADVILAAGSVGLHAGRSSLRHARAAKSAPDKAESESSHERPAREDQIP